MSRSEIIEGCVEILCQKGCRSVREDIQRLERGEDLPELAGLDDLSRRLVMVELREIMAVYGDSCPLPSAQTIGKEGVKHGKNN